MHMHNLLPELLPPSLKADTAQIIIQPSLLGKAGELLTRIGFDKTQLVLVCDTATYAALGKRLMDELAGFKPELLLLEGKPHADEATVNRLRGHPAQALIAVGSGTLSDLCKYASCQNHKPYAVFPTAPSMNGYLSANASITAQGHKQTLAAHLPRGVFCDLDVLAAAPKRLIRSGLGDSLCRSTAQADWLLSHLLFDTAYSAEPFEMLKPYERELFAHADKLMTGDTKVMELLMKTLLVSGLGMVLAGGSYPASQGEHLVAHTMEMKYGDTLPETYHGEQIGVTTLTMAKIQAELLARPLQLRKRDTCEKSIAAYFGSALAGSVSKANWPKQLLMAHYDEINTRLANTDIRDTIRSVTLPEPYLRETLTQAGAPTTPAELGWNERDYDLAVSHARFIRDRFTFLDVI